MNVEKLKQIVHKENLPMPILYGEGTSQTDSVILKHKDDTWSVYIVGERADILESTLRTFDNESDALEHVLLKLRQSKKARHALLKLFKNKEKKLKGKPEPTHAQQVNGANRSALTDNIRPFAEQLRFTLNQMNGTSYWAYGIWRAPEGTDFTKEIPYTEEFLQAVGSADGMSLEVRTLDPDDKKIAYQFTLGKPGDYSGKPIEKISFYDGRLSKEVFSNEIFTADEAATVFYTYFETNGVTRFYNLREFSVTKNVGLKPPVSQYGLNDVIDHATLSDGIVIYLSKGKSSFPKRNDEAVRAFALEANVNPKRLQLKIYEIYNKCMTINIDWSEKSLAEGGKEARYVMAGMYPNLNDAALDALTWSFTYNNR